MAAPYVCREEVLILLTWCVHKCGIGEAWRDPRYALPPTSKKRAFWEDVIELLKLYHKMNRMIKSVSYNLYLILIIMYVCSCFQLFVTPWTVAHQAPLSMEFSRQEYWSGLPFPPSGDLPNQGIKPVSPVLQADSLPLSHLGTPLIVVHFCFVFIFYWSIVDLQCCANFCYTAATHLYTNIHSLLILFFHFMVYPRRFGYKSLYYTVGPCCLSILNVTVCIY